MDRVCAKCTNNVFTLFHVSTLNYLNPTRCLRFIRVVSTFRSIIDDETELL